jgi:Xaa-Pro aminopeptidase
MKVGNEFLLRRKKLLNMMEADSIAVLFAGDFKIRNGESEYPFRPDSDFYYLTAFCEDSAIALFIPGRNEGEFILFNHPFDPLKEQWTGKIVGQDNACSEYGVDQAYSLAKADSLIPELLLGHETIYTNLDVSAQGKSALGTWLEQTKGKARLGINYPVTIKQIGEITHEMRMIKDDAELTSIRRACDISVEAHTALMQQCKADMHEYELDAVLNYEFTKNGCSGVAFDSIVAAGANATILHYPQKGGLLKDGELVLIDAGVEFDYYASDISRTFPVNGKFSPEQSAVYQAVLNVQQQVIEQIKPGVSWFSLEQLTQHLITAELVKLDLLNGEIDELVANQAYRPFYMHHFGHWMGLDDHDVGKYRDGDMWRQLEPNMVLTVEPGIYISPKLDVDPKWHGIGVRIEDDILVTETGYENLTAAAPKEIADIEQLISK